MRSIVIRLSIGLFLHFIAIGLALYLCYQLFQLTKTKPDNVREEEKDESNDLEIVASESKEEESKV